MEEMGTNAWLLPPYPSHVQNGIQCPDYVRFSLIGITLGHRINRTTDRYQRESLAKSYWEYRGRVIQSLTESIQAQQSQPNNFILAGIMTLLLADVRILDFVECMYCHRNFILTMLPKRPNMAHLSTPDAISRPSFALSACGTVSPKSHGRNILIPCSFASCRTSCQFLTLSLT